jgi:hypothetical protein
MKCGTVYYDEAFPYSDGPEGKKLVIVLSEYGTSWLVVKTTSQPDGKQTTPGCHPADKIPNFYLPFGTCQFKKDTWVELEELFEHVDYVHETKTQDGTIVIFKESLSSDLMRQIIECALQSPDIDGFEKEHLRACLAKM